MKNMNLKIFIVYCFTIFFKFAYSESNCGTSLCVSTNVIKPGQPVQLSWHKSDNKNGIQISLLYGDNSDKTDCRELQGKQVLKSWRLKNGEEEYTFTINDVDFEIQDKTFVFLVEYLASSFCMMAPSGPKGLGTSYVVFDKTMPVKINSEQNNATPSNKSDTKASPTTNSNTNSTSENKDNSNLSDKINSNNNSNNNNTNSTNVNNGVNNNNSNNSTNTPLEGDKNKQMDTKDHSDGFFNTFTTILIVILGAILILIALCLILFCAKKIKGKGNSLNEDSLKQNSTARMLSQSLTDDAFAEDSVYSSVNITNAIPAPKSNLNPNEPYVHNVSVESFNSNTSQSGLISRHEAKMIAERFRCELQNPLNNEADDASSIKEKDESV